MPKKKILIIAPVTPHKSEIKLIASTLAFLNHDYILDFIDPLSIMNDLPLEEYYRLWEQQLKQSIADYDVFFGFSFGGVILQQCFSLFLPLKKPIILFSTPTLADKTLKDTLGKVIHLCQSNQLEKALQTLYQTVYFPNEMPNMVYKNSEESAAKERLVFGLNKVLETNSTESVTQSELNHLHLIGELSQLVNQDNVLPPKCGKLITVPGAGMRILQDNPIFCERVILETLNCESN